MTNRFVAIVLAVWMSSAALVALVAIAAPPHVAAGGLFGPGLDVSPGPSNPANAADFVFYSTNQPGYPLLTGADSITPADNVLPMLWAEDVGASWNWIDGDAMVAVGEARRGVNGWAGANQTLSVDGNLRVGASVQDFGNGTLEAIPTVTSAPGPDNVLLSWPPLADANGNVVSYEVFHATSAAGPWTTAVARVPQGATPSTDQTGLTPGLHCYAMGVNYRRDTGTAVYTTTGLSEPVCATIVDVAPRILSTSPVDGTVGVAVNAVITVTFSEPMDTATVVPTIAPFLAMVASWSGGDTVLTLNHGTDFTPCSNYVVTIAGDDLTGNPLGVGPVVNPFDFTALCPAPFITLTTPASGAVQVRTTSTIVVRFSEPMVTATVVWTIAPALPNSSAWNVPTNDTVTITPTLGLAETTVYTVNVIAGQDVDGNSIVAGSIPNPWSFTTNTRPTVTMDPTSTLVGACVTGGSALDIPWSMIDPETAAGLLMVTLRSTGATTMTITGPIPGWTSPFGYSWTTPGAINGNVQILIEVADVPGDTDQDTSASVEIDSTAPTVSPFTPADASTDIPTDVVVRITFSEAMDRPATQGAILILPATPGSTTFVWSAGDTVLNITAAFQPTTTYTVTVGLGARDACSPGLTLATARSQTFTTGAGPKVPNAPTGLSASAAGTTITLTWARPTAYSDGSSLQSTDILYYIVYRLTTATGTPVQISMPNATTFVDSSVVAGTRYWYWVRVRDINNRESVLSLPSDALARSPAPADFPWLLLLIPIIVILLVLGIWLMRRKKPEGAPPPAKAPPGGPSGEAAPQEPPGAGAEEAPPEPASEGSGEFLACPNCGTMVKPTDAECFVCGAKL